MRNKIVKIQQVFRARRILRSVRLLRAKQNKKATPLIQAVMRGYLDR